MIQHGLGALRHMTLVLSLRLLPFAVWGVAGRPTGLGTKLLVAIGWAALPVVACWLGAASSVVIIGAGATYYLVLCLGVNWLRARMATGQITRGAALVLIFGAFLLAPGVLLPGSAIALFMVIGWELALSTYSYCVETSRPGATSGSTSECLFFILVNPTLFYGARGAPLEARGANRGLLRATAGAALMFVNVAVAWPLAEYLHEIGASPTTRAAVAVWLAYGVVRFLSLYAAHSGLASIHIGLMNQLGWRVPERYCYPLAATSPMDFWRRWNTYVRLWLEAYVFLPIARGVARKNRGRAGQAAAAMTTLLVSGLIHDAYVFAGRQTFAGFQMTQIFLGASLLLVVWRLAAAVGRMFRERFEPRALTWFDLATTLISRVALAAALVGAAIEWG
jgi:hypothetical protein